MNVQRIRDLDPNWFALVMGTGIVANAAGLLPVHVAGLREFAVGLWRLAGAMVVFVAGGNDRALAALSQRGAPASELARDRIATNAIVSSAAWRTTPWRRASRGDPRSSLSTANQCLARAEIGRVAALLLRDGDEHAALAELRPARRGWRPAGPYRT
jgi:hypothetical protein